MKELDKNWLTNGWIDFEYKKYMLLAYLQEVKYNFDVVKLYPYFSDLIFHYQNLLTLKNNKQLIFENFPKEISKADFEKLTLQYQSFVKDDDLMLELEEIILFALPQLQNTLNEGKSIFDLAEENIEISPVGITPLRTDEGYFFIKEKDTKAMQVFEYQMTIFENIQEKFRGINVVFLETVEKNLVNTYENIKIDLVRRYKKIPNPATYLIYSNLTLPLQETLLPIAKQLLVRYVSQ